MLVPTCACLTRGECYVLVPTCARLSGGASEPGFTPTVGVGGLPCRLSRGCNMLVLTYVTLAGLNVACWYLHYVGLARLRVDLTCWYLPVQVSPGVLVNPVLHLQSVWELASPLISGV